MSISSSSFLKRVSSDELASSEPVHCSVLYSITSMCTGLLLRAGLEKEKFPLKEFRIIIEDSIYTFLCCGFGRLLFALFHFWKAVEGS